MGPQRIRLAGCAAAVLMLTACTVNPPGTHLSPSGQAEATFSAMDPGYVLRSHMKKLQRTSPLREVVEQLAPSGKLRAAINFGNPILAYRDQWAEKLNLNLVIASVEDATSPEPCACTHSSASPL